MENISLVGKSKYIPAKPDNVTTEEVIRNSLKFLWILLKSFLDYLPYLLYSIYEFVVGKKPKNIHGQLALVTGSANGFGKELAHQLAKQGCNIAVVDLSIEEAKVAAQSIAEEYGVKTKAFSCDVSDYEAVQKLKTDVEKSLGSVDILVNNAAVLPLLSLREGEQKDIQKIIDVNLSSHFWTCRTFLNKMIERKRGHIVAIASTASFYPMPRTCAYCATKFGVRGLMQTLKLELFLDAQDDFIKLTTVCPWFMRTRQELCDAVNKTTPFQYIIDPKDAAEIVVKGILIDEEFVFVPGVFSLIMKLTSYLPTQYYKYFYLNYYKNPQEKLMEMKE